MLPARHHPRFALRSYQGGGATHVHDHAQAVFALVGSMALAMGDNRGQVAEGTGALVPAQLPHLYSTAGANRFVVLDFDCAAPAGSFFSFDAELSHLLRYVNELGSRDSLAPDTEMHATALLSAAVRCRLPGVPRYTAPVRRALALMHERFDKPLTVAELAAAAGLSASHLHAEFRRQLGKSPARQLADVRLDAAIERLRSSDEAIAQIALACGYSEQSALNRALRRRLNTTPAALRRS